jgi:hypothetical protein
VLMMLSLASGGSATLSVTDRCRYGAVMESPCSFEFRVTDQYSSLQK